VYAGRNMKIRGNPAATGPFSASSLQRAKSIRLCPLGSARSGSRARKLRPGSYLEKRARTRPCSLR
jgi:hypothetical protein